MSCMCLCAYCKNLETCEDGPVLGRLVDSCPDYEEKQNAPETDLEDALPGAEGEGSTPEKVIWCKDSIAQNGGERKP